MKREKKRWYDNNRALVKQLENLKNIHIKNKDNIIAGLWDIIKNSNPVILNKFTIPTDIELWYRRWYDKDATYWIVLNCLKHADKKLLEKVTSYLENELVIK